MRPRLPPFRSLHATFLWATVLLIFLLMSAVIVVVDHRQRAAIIEEGERRGEILARNLAAISQAPLLLYNFTALEQNVARVGGEEDVLYAILLDADGRVAADSQRPDRVGTLLGGAVADAAVASEEAITQETTLSGTREHIYDFAVPIVVERRRWGTARVGLSKQRMEAEIARTRFELLGLTAATLLLGAFAAAVVARRIARPVRQLAEGASAISRGELMQRIEPSGFAEIGALAAAFNHMASQLFLQHRALEDANEELRRRFGELEDVKRYTENILGSLTNGIVTVDLDGRIVTLNPAAEMLTGFFAGEVASHYCTELFAQTPEIGEMLMETLATRMPIAGVALSLKRRSGATLPVEVSTAPLKGAEGKDLGVMAMMRDLTLVRELESRLRRSDRLAALGGLAAGLAHEIKNPLTSVITFSRHVGRRFDDPSFRDRFQRVVPRELERINGIIERLLELARPAPATFGRVRLSSLMDRAVDLFANEIETQGVQVARDYARDLPQIAAHEESLYRAVINLIGNALDAMEHGGRLSLRVAWSVSDGRRPGRAALANRHVLIEVGDTGPGIQPDQADKLFTPFFTTKEHGTGLGLAVTHKIVEDHGGMIDFTSVPGMGTTFRIVLPLTPPAAAEPTDAARR
jgi:two-component system sensor histidine kinase AtoS